MMDQRDNTPALITPYECTLAWCILTLLGAPGTTPGRPPTLPDRSGDSASVPSADCHLTTRETEVLGLVSLGLTNQQVAARLFLSRRTVEQHVSSIYNRLGVSSRAAATRFAILNNVC